MWCFRVTPITAKPCSAVLVSASSERIDFVAVARLGEIVEMTGRIVRIWRQSIRTRRNFV